MGDSTGGNLAHALTQYLVDYQDAMEIDLPNPPGVLLLSPWLDLIPCTCHKMGRTRRSLNSYIGGREVSYSKCAFLGPHRPFQLKTTSSVCLLSKTQVDFKRFPGTFINNAGGAEGLRDYTL